MIPVLRSLDSLLNRFDELSQRHASLVTNFDTNFTNIENPLHDVSRNVEEQRKTVENLTKTTMENGAQFGSSDTVDDFNRRVTRSRGSNRPPSYFSNDGNAFLHRILSKSSWGTTESAPPPRTSTRPMTQPTIKTSISRAVPSTSLDNLIESKGRMTTKIKPKVVPPNPSIIRQNTRIPITRFTMETAIRLSRPRSYHHAPEQKVSPKRIHRRPRLLQNIKKEATESLVTSAPLPSPPQTAPPHTKRINPTITKSSLKKLKADNRFIIDNSRRFPLSNYPRPAIFLAPPPTISLAFPMQPELKSSCVVVTPKTNPLIPRPTTKTINIFTNKRTIIPPNRMMYLMT